MYKHKVVFPKLAYDMIKIRYFKDEAININQASDTNLLKSHGRSRIPVEISFQLNIDRFYIL